MLEQIGFDLRYAMRQFARNRGFAVTVVLTIALGVGLNTAMFSLIRAVLLQPLGYGDPDRLVELTTGATPIRYEAARAGAKSYAGLGAYGAEESFAFSGDGVPEVLKGARVSGNFLEILEVRPVAGRGFFPAEDKDGAPAVAMISTRLWQRRFGGSPAVTGRVIMLSGVATTIVGVLPAGFQFPSEGADVWVPRPADWTAIDAISRPISPILTMFGRLRPDVTIEQARAELKVLQSAYAAAHPAMLDAERPTPPDVENLKDVLVEDAAAKLWMLFGAVGLVLLIVCANVASLLLARATAREKEFAVRAAIGGGRRQIVRLLLTESLLLAFAGGGLGVMLAEASVRLIRGTTALNLPRMGDVRIDGSVLLYAVLVSVLTGLLFGLAPATAAARPDLARVLRGSGEGSAAGAGRRGWFALKPRSALVVGQVALSTVLLIAAALLIESLGLVYRVDPGFEVQHVLTLDLELPAARYESDVKRSTFYRQLVDSVNTLPGVENSAITRSLPMTGWAGIPLAVSGRPEIKLNKRPIAILEEVSPGYFATLKIRLMRGREFTDRDDANAPPVALINEAAARLLWPQYPQGADPVGEYVLIGGHSTPTKVVGVVNDVRESGLDTEVRPGVYRAAWQRPPEEAMVAVRTGGDPMALANAVRGRVLALDRDQPVSNVASMASVVDDSEGELRAMMRLLAVFAAAAGLISVVGMYGVIAYSVSQRTKEMGIRRALGAQGGDILRLITGQGLRLGVAGVTLGLGGAYALTRLLGTLLFGVSARDPFTFAGIAIMFIAVALAASYLPALSAARVDPMESLRM
jgi:putative ABC transport system permease protein